MNNKLSTKALPESSLDFVITPSDETKIAFRGILLSESEHLVDYDGGEAWNKLYKTIDGHFILNAFYGKYSPKWSIRHKVFVFEHPKELLGYFQENRVFSQWIKNLENQHE